LIDLFDQTGGAFLMLGGPGAGKTTMLLDLCRDLISRARHNSAHPIPIVFNLSTWRGEALADWLVKELKHQYNVSPTIAQTWVAHKNLCLLLDGLDEVAPHRRTICVEAINTFRQDLLPIVVCGRSEAYQALSTKLSLATAVVIQPLTDHQIEAYLTQPAFNLEAVRGTLRADPDLRALIDTPFMLSIITLAYRGKSFDDLESLKTFSDRRARIFDIYLQQALSRRPGVTYAPSQTLGYLEWLAAQSNVRNQTIFHLEDIRCDWLPGKPQQMIYRLSIGLLYGCGFWLIGGPLLATMGGPVFGAIGGMAFGLLGGIAFGRQVDKEPAEKLTLSRSRFLKFGLFFGLAFGSVFGGVAGLLGGFETGLFLGIIFGAFFGMAFGLGGGLKPNPQITAHTRVGQGTTQSLGNGLTFGLEMGLISGFLFFAMAGLPVGLLIGAGVGLVIGLLNGGHFVIQALFIYFLLAQAGIIPLRLISFLNDATDKIILQRVGPGYQFIHRLLQDHLAARYEADSTTAASTKNA
jgi:hypothetical protein